MPNINENPVNQNLLQGSKFSMSFIRLPYIQFFVQAVNLPGITVPAQEQPTPLVNAPIPGNKLTYDNFEMVFLIDEPMWSWTSIHDWLTAIGIPESTDQYKNLSLQQRLQTQSQKPQYSDGTLIIMTNKNNPILTINFTDMFPTSLTGVPFSTEDSAADIKTATATFGFTNYDISRGL